MESILYHASIKGLKVDDLLKIADRMVSDIRRPADDVLECHRHGRSTSRSAAFFATADPADSVVYLQSELRCRKAQIHLYRVGMPSPHSHPMAVIDLIRKAIATQASTSCLERLAEEYWQPKQPWRYMEFMAQTMTVLEELLLPDTDLITGARCRYFDDYARAQDFLRSILDDEPNGQGSLRKSTTSGANEESQ